MLNTIPVLEIFGPTIQGEGPNIGERCIFVRVKGCSYRCSWCDSKYTWNVNSSEGQNYSEDLLSKHLIGLCKESNCNRIVITGGNPCIYHFESVITDLKCKGIKVDIETQGDLYPEWLSNASQIVFSPKAPSSGMPDTYDKIVKYIEENNYIQSADVAIKIPVFNDEDIEFARKYAKFVNEFVYQHDNNINLKMYLSVGNSDVDTAEAIRDRVLSDYEKLLNKINKNPEHFENISILPQLHTLVWGNKQGV